MEFPADLDSEEDYIFNSHVLVAHENQRVFVMRKSFKGSGKWEPVPLADIRHQESLQRLRREYDPGSIARLPFGDKEHEYLLRENDLL